MSFLSFFLFSLCGISEKISFHQQTELIIMSLLSAIFNRAESILFFIVFFGLHYCILKYILSKPYINSFPVISFFCIFFIGFFVSVIFVVGWMRCSHHIASIKERMIANITNHWWIKAILSNEYGFFIIAVSVRKQKIASLTLSSIMLMQMDSTHPMLTHGT